MRATCLKKLCAAISLLSATLSTTLSATTAVAVEKTAAVAPSLTDTSVSGNLLQTTFGLLIVLALIGGVALLFKRFSSYQVGAQGKIKIVGGVSLGTRERVVLLQVGDSQLLLGVAPGQIRTLHVLDKPLDMQAPADNVQSFAARLQAVLKGQAVRNGKESP